jgi:hypothetical protein
MGVDIVGWRACPLQQQEGEDGFFHKLKLVAYKRETERLVPEPAKRATVTLKIRISGQSDQLLSYPQVIEAVGDFASGIPECSSCPLAEQQPLGCYRYISYPVPSEIEESLAAFAEHELESEDSPLRLLVEQYVQNDQLRVLSDDFRSNRGAQPGHLAMRPAPVPVTLSDPMFDGFDSADLLSILITPFREGAELALEADVLETWLGHRPAGGAHEGNWSEWTAFARLIREATALSLQMPDIAVLFDG